MKAFIILLTFSFLLQLSSFSQPNIKLSKLWELNEGLLTPESVVYDSKRNCLYVSNFNDKGGFRQRTDTLRDEYISKVDLDGNIIEQKWVDNLLGPTGIEIHNDKLYVVERGFLTTIDIEKQAITEQIKIPETRFLNDVAINKKGDIFISDSGKRCIVKVKDGNYETWLTDTIMQNCNGLFIDNKKLIIGNAGSANLISVTPPNTTIDTLASNIAVGIDGLKKYKKNLVISFRYNISIVDKKGNAQQILDTSENEEWNADLELIENKKLILVPTLASNKLVAYEIVD